MTNVQKQILKVIFFHSQSKPQSQSLALLPALCVLDALSLSLPGAQRDGYDG